MAAIFGPHYQFRALHWYHFTITNLHGCKKHSGKANQLTIDTGGSEHALLFNVYMYV